MPISSTLLGHVFTRKLFAFAGNTLLAYDYFLTLSLEIAFIWNAPWSFVKTFFLINRYGNLIGQSYIFLEETGYWGHGSQQYCVAFAQFYAFFSFFSGESVRLLVLMRTCAILGCRRRIAVSWSALYFLYALTILVVSIYCLRHDACGTVEFMHVDEIDVCFASVEPGRWAVWLIPLTLDCLMFAIACCSLYRLTRWSPGRSPSRLIRLLARDAAVFYCAALFNVLSVIVCWTIYGRDPRDYIAALISYPILSVIGQRLILNLRRQRAQPNSTRDFSQDINRQLEEILAKRSDLEFDLSFESSQEGCESE